MQPPYAALCLLHPVKTKTKQKFVLGHFCRPLINMGIPLRPHSLQSELISNFFKYTHVKTYSGGLDFLNKSGYKMQGVFKFVSGIHGVLMLLLSFCSGWFCQHDTIYNH